MALILIMGIPASGKSTLCRRLQTAHPELIESTSFDDFRMTNPMDNAREARKAFESHVEKEISKISSSGDSKQRIFLIEDIFYMKSMRRPFHKISRKHQLEFGVVHLNISTNDAVRRNSLRKEQQTEETILKVFEKLELPDQEKSVVLERDEAKEIELEGLLEKLGIEMRREKPRNKEVQEVSRKRKMEKNNPSSSPTSAPVSCLPLQDFDVLTRRLVSELIQNDRSIDGKKMSIARSMLISEEANIHLNSCELKLKLVDVYDKLL